ncbi:hypothetical protein K461DRAFT_268097 [Myriangium duriaei CBS 260.36]|uniref:Rhodopsin domain-containing protein n=1 Tax=Myriangium duriaei CBS 260.36 TaxID=1168546 RepID=A0A9P4J6Y7_9PEZI|nr:hypothetical protein K461DRAFT_268097 [Myriangium duriaei CBS 260.36]
MAKESFAQLAYDQKRLSIILLVISSIAVPLRLFVRIKILRCVSAADYAIVLAYLFFLGMITTDMLVYTTISPTNLNIHVFVGCTLAYNTLYAATSVCSKLSISLFVIHILGPLRPVQRAVVITVLVISSILAVINTALVLNCGVMVLLDRSATPLCEGSKAPNKLMTIAWTATNITADTVYALLCLGMIWSANLTIKSKLIAGLLLSFGSLGAIVSVLRLLASAGWGWTGFYQGLILVARFSNLESGITITAICLATTKPLVMKFINLFSRPRQSLTGLNLNPAEFSHNPTCDNTCLWHQPGIIAYSYPLEGGVTTDIVIGKRSGSVCLCVEDKPRHSTV